MPMCDLYIQEGALEAAAEAALVSRVSDLLVEHEMRRIVDLVDDPSTVQASTTQAKSIAWMFVHRTGTYIAGQPVGPDTPTGPAYKFVVSIPEGQIDDEFIPAINRDIMSAVQEAEARSWPHLAARVWVHVHEIPDGHWGAGGRQMHLEGIIDYVAPGFGKLAVARWNKLQDDHAAAAPAVSNA